LVKDKGVLDLAEAFAMAAGCSGKFWLLVVGPDEEGIGDVLRQRVALHADRLVMVGFTAEPQKYMAAADFFCLPSYREGFPVSILEAAAVGLPSIASNIYGVSDAVVDGETGLLFRAGDVDQLSGAMRCLVMDACLRARLGVAARQRVEREFDAFVVVG
jgi:glycosyltransferase involved in cell wall biosynthesis